MEVQVKVLSYNVTDKQRERLPKSIIVNSIKVEVNFREETIIEVEGLSGYYAPEFTPDPFLVDGESVVKLADAAEAQGIDLFEAGPFWFKVDGAIAEILKQIKAKIA